MRLVSPAQTKEARCSGHFCTTEPAYFQRSAHLACSLLIDRGCCRGLRLSRQIVVSVCIVRAGPSDLHAEGIHHLPGPSVLPGPLASKPLHCRLLIIVSPQYHHCTPSFSRHCCHSTVGASASLITHVQATQPKTPALAMESCQEYRSKQWNDGGHIDTRYRMQENAHTQKQNTHIYASLNAIQIIVHPHTCCATPRP